ncbi:class II aaRS and biotin synthetase [Artomyces pyxidatus]|uniref:Class II aaRS and biotin synthetase n=1 Tax=Artomyces pyxidatus TaxID=48021 RepID=A0ACB8SM42_9AGAM|nr:class II aaRS and biotin synthetase [Artomyces pyxidatus]
MDVLIYTPSPETLTTIRPLLNPNYTVQPITSVSLATYPWTGSCALLVLHAHDAALPVSQPAIQAVQRYLSAGGRVLGLGWGVSIAGVPSPLGELEFWDQTSRVAVKMVASASRDEPRPQASVRLQSGDVVAGLRKEGANFALLDKPRWSCLARWEPHAAGMAGAMESRPSTDPVAGIELAVGDGRIALWDVSLADGQTGAISAILRHAFSQLGLSLPPPSASVVAMDVDAPALPPAPTHPLPQFLFARPHIAEKAKASLPVTLPDTTATSPADLVDTVDTFHFHFLSPSEGKQLLDNARLQPKGEGSPKDIVVLPVGSEAVRELTPRFDVARFFKLLAETRTSDGTWGIGDALLYGEAVTSTQTMLEKNLQILRGLPSPFVSLASFQLAGRGRGTNSWLSPAGCLQFSILLRVPFACFSVSRLVFIQYLFGLAVVHALRDPRALGGEGSRVRLKWPNDIYIETPTGEKKKVGGVLVNTNFLGKTVDIVIGCGLNISTADPIAALSLLAPPDRPLSMEMVLALILSKFDGMWQSFLRERASWAPFADDYLDVWMHSDQLVTLTTVSPSLPVRIIGITLDHGLLRTVPERSGGSRGTRTTNDEGYIDLQPDGNSFDMMAGLIKAKQ